MVRLAAQHDETPVELLEQTAAEPADIEIAVLEPPPARPMSEERRAEYEAQRPKNVVALQPWRVEHSLGEDLRIIDLHPRFHRALLLEVGRRTWALEVRDPESTVVDLDKSDATGLALIHLGDDGISRCAPWQGSPSALEAASSAGRPYVRICDDHLLVRTTVAGRKSTLEWATDLVRNNVAGGDHVATLVKKTTQDRFRKDADVGDADRGAPQSAGPPPIRLAAASERADIAVGDLGLPIDAGPRIHAGAWLPVQRQPAVYATAVAPKLVEPVVDEADRARLATTDTVEAGALVLLVAFDLDQLDLELEVGTEHPGVEWSTGVSREQRVGDLPGPDGLATLAPLGRSGQVPPAEATRLVASFTGGFKREHAAFKQGELARRNGGSHYGLIQDGIVHSKLQPGLATLVVYEGGRVDVRTWTTDDDDDLEQVLHARQNGSPLVTSVDGTPRPGALIADWRTGNWSGSAAGENRTIRAGACIQESDRGQYLVYGYFTAATPRVMATVFLAAGCRDAIHLDMNALEHTYAAVYERGPDDGWIVHHLDRGMAVLDKKRKDVVLPRFVAFADNRDFFTLVRQREP